MTMINGVVVDYDQPHPNTHHPHVCRHGGLAQPTDDANGARHDATTAVSTDAPRSCYYGHVSDFYRRISVTAAASLVVRSVALQSKANHGNVSSKRK